MEELTAAVCWRCGAVQDSVLKSLLGQLPAVEVEDLPGLVKYLLSSADKANAEQVGPAASAASIQAARP